MKKIDSIFFVAIASLFLAPVLNAQTIEQYIKSKYGNSATITFPNDKGTQVIEDKKVAYSKNVSSPFNDGTYYIKLETFATGSASYEYVAAPVDIVLVLDFSQSMTATYYTSGSGVHYIPQISNQNNQNGNWTYQYLNQNTRYIEYDGEYCEIKIDRTEAAFNEGGYGWAYFETTNGKTYYLDGNEVTTTQPVWSGTGNFGNNSILWTGALFERTTGSVTRVNALKEAVADFIDVIYRNDNYDDKGVKRDTPLGNRISIVVFSGNSTTNSRQIAGWTNVTTADGAKDETLLRSIAAETSTPIGTYSNRGMNLANTLLGNITAERKEVSSRTVVLFTDGVPGNTTSWNTTSDTVAENCIDEAFIAKNTHTATVFTVALYSWPSSITGNEKSMRDYLNFVSSNYKLADGMDTDPASGTYDGIYRKDAGQDLAAVFRQIAEQSSAESTTLSTATSTVDVVSNSFMLPQGVDADNIRDYVKIFTAPLTSMTTTGGKTTYNFGTEMMAPSNTYTYDADGNQVAPGTEGGTDIDNNVGVALIDNNGIKVTNFDYSKNWCGPIVDNTQTPPVTTYRGHKIIILIPIKMNPDAVGGPNVSTNGEGSGIYVDDDALEAGDSFITFDSPTVSLPVNLYIEKHGITGTESAKFRIERGIIPIVAEGETWSVSDITQWDYVSTVFVTNSSTNSKHNPDTGNPWVKVRGLPATMMVNNVQRGLVYRISEEPWSWTYKDKLPEGVTLEEGATYYLYTDTEHIENPFFFDNETINERIDVLIRHSESKATNIFKTGETEGHYDDLKPRKTTTN